MLEATSDPTVKPLLRPADLDNDVAMRHILQLLHPGGTVCPDCGSTDFSHRLRESWAKGQRVLCKACGRRFCARTGTHFEGSSLGWRQIAVALHLLACGCSPDVVARQIGCHADTIRRMQDRLMVSR